MAHIRGNTKDRKFYTFNRLENDWEVTDMIDIKQGDIFSIWDNGLRYIDDRGNTVFIAASDAKYVGDLIWQIDTLY